VNGGARALLLLLRVYQAFFSALMPSACKFYPSCSHYAAGAVGIHGAWRGSWLALRRIARCHPFTRGGVDLVPEAADFSEDKSGAGGAMVFAAPASRRLFNFSRRVPIAGKMPALHKQSIPMAIGSTVDRMHVRDAEKIHNQSVAKFDQFGEEAGL